MVRLFHFYFNFQRENIISKFFKVMRTSILLVFVTPIGCALGLQIFSNEFVDFYFFQINLNVKSTKNAEHVYFALFE
jgi:hypothetical protein